MIGKNYCIWLLKITKTRITFFDLFRGRSKSYFRFLLSAMFLGHKNEIIQTNKIHLKKYFCGLKNGEYNSSCHILGELR
jgi:hypothetical protein